MHRKFPSELICLNFHSLKVHRYLRGTCLLHPRTVTECYESANREVVCTFEALSRACQWVCQLLFSVQSCSQRNGHLETLRVGWYKVSRLYRHLGSNLGCSANDMLMIFSVNGDWEICLLLPSRVHKCWVRQCSIKSRESGIGVVSIMMDGCTANISTGMFIWTKYSEDIFYATGCGTKWQFSSNFLSRATLHNH